MGKWHTIYAEELKEKTWVGTLTPTHISYVILKQSINHSEPVIYA